LRVPFSLFIVTINSRYPSKFIPISHIRSSLTASVNRVVPFRTGKLKLTPPIDLDYFRGNIKDGSVVFVRDISGDMFADESMYSESEVREGKLCQLQS